MKKYILIAIAVVAMVSITGCSDFLDEDLKSELDPANTYNSSYGFEVGSTGLYGIARSEYNTYGSSFFMHGSACPYEALQITTDIATMGTKDSSLQPFGYLTLTSNTAIVGSYWNWAYSLIAAANEILKYSEINTNWDNDTDKSLYQAEARFFRAYAYRTLVYLYGDVPYVDKVEDNGFRLDFTRTPKSDVLDHMIEDLSFAVDNLPENPDTFDKTDKEEMKDGKLTKWAAEHLLSEVYLMKGEYKKAEEAALAVINSGYFELMETRFGGNKDVAGDVYSDLFIEYNQNRKSGNKESIWVMQFEYNTTGGGGEYDDWTRRAWEPKYFEMSGFVLADSLGGRGLSQLVPMKWWIDDNTGFFDKTDIRNSEYNIKRSWYYNDASKPELYGQKAEITDDTWMVTNRLYPALTKFFYGRPENLSYGGTNRDRMKFRLAETYLYLCEARLMQGDTEGAAQAINVVRKRANAKEITSSEMTLDFLLDERIRELVGEESRRFTLVRTNKLIERTKKYNTESGAVIRDYHVLWPIPQSIIDSNRDADFPQNPGY